MSYARATNSFFLAILSLIAVATSRVVTSETFQEYLVTEPLPTSEFLTSFHFHFGLTRPVLSDSGGIQPVPFRSFPSTVARAVESYRPLSFDISLANGVWDTSFHGTQYFSSSSNNDVSIEEWTSGSPMPSTLSSSFFPRKPALNGATVTASFSIDSSVNDTEKHELSGKADFVASKTSSSALSRVTQRFAGLLHNLSGYICGSMSFAILDHLAPTTYTISSSKASSTSIITFTVFLTRDYACVENIIPMLDALPCGQTRGIASIIPSPSYIFRGAYTSAHISFQRRVTKDMMNDTVSDAASLESWDFAQTIVLVQNTAPFTHALEVTQSSKMSESTTSENLQEEISMPVTSLSLGWQNIPKQNVAPIASPRLGTSSSPSSSSSSQSSTLSTIALVSTILTCPGTTRTLTLFRIPTWLCSEKTSKTSLALDTSEIAGCKALYDLYNDSSPQKDTEEKKTEDSRSISSTAMQSYLSQFRQSLKHNTKSQLWFPSLARAFEPTIVRCKPTLSFPSSLSSLWLSFDPTEKAFLQQKRILQRELRSVEGVKENRKDSSMSLAQLLSQGILPIVPFDSIIIANVYADILSASSMSSSTPLISTSMPLPPVEVVHTLMRVSAQETTSVSTKANNSHLSHLDSSPVRFEKKVAGSALFGGAIQYHASLRLRSQLPSAATPSHTLLRVDDLHPWFAGAPHFSQMTIFINEVAYSVSISSLNSAPSTWPDLESFIATHPRTALLFLEKYDPIFDGSSHQFTTGRGEYLSYSLFIPFSLEAQGRGSKVVVSISLPITKSLLTAGEHYTDASKGIDLPPATLSLYAPHAQFPNASPVSIVSPGPLLQSLLPDPSMPFNVIAIVCTALAFVFGSMFNILSASDSDFVLLQGPNVIAKAKLKVQEKFHKKALDKALKSFENERGEMDNELFENNPSEVSRKNKVENNESDDSINIEKDSSSGFPPHDSIHPLISSDGKFTPPVSKPSSVRLTLRQEKELIRNGGECVQVDGMLLPLQNEPSENLSNALREMSKVLSSAKSGSSHNANTISQAEEKKPFTKSI